MELQTIDKRIKVVQTIFDSVDERPLDCDFVLPDYLPDVAAVLKCIVNPAVQNYQISSDRVMADGIVHMRLWYLDEERRLVHTFENSQPFTAAFTVKDLDSSCRVQLSATTNYVNCRATGPRRVDIHGAFGVRLKVMGEREETVIEAIDDSRVHCQQCHVEYSHQVAFSEKTFTINEVVELENGARAESLIRTCAVPRITDCKKLAGKAVVKGEIVLKTVYLSNTTSGQLCTSENVVLFSQIVDADGLTEEQICSCKAALLMYETHPVANPNGEQTLLSFIAKLSVVLHAYETNTCTVVTDAYHTAYPLKCRTRTIEPWCAVEHRCETKTMVLSVDCPDTSIRTIEDLWCDVISTDNHRNGNVNSTAVRLLVSMLTRDEKGVLSYYERPVECVIDHGEQSGSYDCEISLLRCVYALAGDHIELQLHAECCGLVVNTYDYAVIGEMVADEKMPYTPNEDMKDCCMKVYFASKGESVWDIAKTQHLPLDLLCYENDLHGEVLTEDMALLLPL